jgi:hypothetical protein
VTSDISIRLKSTQDGAEANANGVGARNLLRLYLIEKYSSLASVMLPANSSGTHSKGSEKVENYGGLISSNVTSHLDRYEKILQSSSHASPSLLTAHAEFGDEDSVAVIKLNQKDSTDARRVLLCVLKKHNPSGFILVRTDESVSTVCHQKSCHLASI